MDPNLFHLNWERTFEVLGAIIVLSFFVERALALLFENEWYHRRFGDAHTKELIAFLVSLAVCLYCDFDAVSTVILREKVALPGQILTAAIIAGGSKASVKLFHDLLKVKNDLPSTPTSSPSSGVASGSDG